MDRVTDLTKFQPGPSLPPGASATAQNPDQNEGSSPRETWNIIRRNRLLVISCTILVVVAVGLFTYLSVPIYQSETSVRIDEKQSGLKDLEFLTGSEHGSQVATEMEVLHSRSLANEVADSLRLQVTLTKPQRISRDQLLSAINVDRSVVPADIVLRRGVDGSLAIVNDSSVKQGKPIHVGDTVSTNGATFVLLPATSEYSDIRLQVKTLRKATDDLLDGLTVSRPTKDADIVMMKFQNPDPQLARDIPNAVARRFIAARKSVQKTEFRSTAAFLRAQLDTLTGQLSASEAELQTFRERNQIVDLGAEGSAQVGQLAKLQAQRMDVEAERAALQSLMDDVQAQAARATPGDASPYRLLLTHPALLTNAASTAYLASITKLEDDRAALLVRKTALDPEVRALTQRINEIELQIVGLAKTYLGALNHQVASLDGALAKFGKQLKQIPAKEVEYARLERQPKVLEGMSIILQQRLKEAEISEAVEDPSVRVVDQAIIPLIPVRPRPRLNLSIALVVGLMAGVMAAFAREQLDRSVHTREDVQRLTGVPVLGLIPRILGASDGSNGKYRFNLHGKPAVLPGLSGLALGEAKPTIQGRLVTGIDPKNPVSEAYRGMRTNITFASPDRRAKTIVFTSPMPGDGKTTSAANLAVTLAQQGIRVLLIDADLRRGVLNNVFGTPREPGLSNALLGSVSPEEAIQKINLGEQGSLHFLSNGTLPPNPAEILGSQRMRTLLNHLSSEYEMVILDSPPLNVVTDAAILGTQVDGVIVVARAGVTDQGALAFAMDQLRNVRANVLGTVLNDVDLRRDSRYYSYSPYGYGGYYYASYYSHTKT